jgi:hypothetical protein
MGAVYFTSAFLLHDIPNLEVCDAETAQYKYCCLVHYYSLFNLFVARQLFITLPH